MRVRERINTQSAVEAAAMFAKLLGLLGDAFDGLKSVQQPDVSQHELRRGETVIRNVVREISMAMVGYDVRFVSYDSN